MADNVTLPGTGIVVASDDVGSGVQVQQIKIDVGGNGATQLMDNTHPVYVTSVGTNALPTGAATEATLVTLNGKFPALGSTTSAGSQPVVIASDQTALPIYQPNVSASGTITTQNLVPAGTATANSAVEVTLSGANALTIQVTGTYTGVLSLQGTVNGTTWVTMAGVCLLNVNTGGYLASITSALQSIFQSDVGGFVKARITGLAAVTGTATVTLVASTGAASMLALDASIPAGANVIGGVTQSGTWNVGTVTPGTAATNLGKAEDAVHASGDVGVMALAVRIDTPATTASASGDYDALHTADNGALQVTITPAAKSGKSLQRVMSAATTNATSTKASAGLLDTVLLQNTSAALKYIKFYNKASSPTVGTDTPVLTLMLPVGSGMVPVGIGMEFTTGIAFAITNLPADSDTTAVALNDVIGGFFYK